MIFSSRSMIATCLIASAMGAAIPSSAAAQQPGHMQLLVDEEKAEGGYGVLGGFTYSPEDDTYWTVLFGAGSGIRRIETGPGEQYVHPTVMQQFIRATDVVGGVTNADYSGNPFQAGILLNPKAITLDYGSELGPDGQLIGSITYQPGELAYISDFNLPVADGDGNYLIDATKRVYRYDLRRVGESGDIGLPDRDNADNGIGNIIGSHGLVDWNDVFSVVATEQDLRDAAGYDSDGRVGSNFGRQFAWSTDGQSLYAVDAGSNTGGLHRIDAVTGEVERLYDGTTQGRIISEPAVVASDVRQLGTGTGDQVLFDGHADHGNDGGISFVTDEGNGGTPGVALAGSQLQAFTGEDGSSIGSIASDAAGNIYFYEKTSKALLRYDGQGRLVSVVNQAQLMAFNESVTQSGDYRDRGGMLRLQVFEDEENGTRIMYRGNNSFVAGASVGQPGDFSGDGAITADDTAFFIDQFQRSALPTPGTQGYADYAQADLNASGRVSGYSDGYDGSLQNRSVDAYDMDVLRQFVNLHAGDTDWNFKVDIDDFRTLKDNFDPTATDASWFDGNFDYHNKGSVNIADFQALKANFNVTGYGTEPASEVSLLSTADFTTTLAGELSLLVHGDGEVFLVGEDAVFDAFQIVGADESILEGNFAGVEGMDTLVGDAYVAGLTLSEVALDGSLSLGHIYDAELDLRDLEFLYNDSVVGAITYVPEPSSMVLVAACGAMLLGRRRGNSARG
ncbi:MAG: hypothetical protein WD294_06515 [Phycisphaeraceae bacterium]